MLNMRGGGAGRGELENVASPRPFGGAAGLREMLEMSLGPGGGLFS